ncbi:hypothetical protein [Bowdeniella nasicola]|uniref:hypothetical protein n=1 Tax=Bowdeniella nasicola TaxID=208480 RepID=UPI001160FB5A|nr:hypothetical protein [Bowdeniella nasicola]
MTADGDLVVATFAAGTAGPDPIIATAGPLEVRMDITKYAPETDVSIISASMHFLAELRWLSHEDVSQLRHEGALPGTIDEIAQLAGARIGIVYAESYLLRSGEGVTSLDAAELAAFAQGPHAYSYVDDYGFQLAAQLPEIDRMLLYSGVTHDYLPGAVLSRMTGIGGCEHIEARVFIVDLDITGLTLMRVSGEVSTVVFAPFNDLAVTSEELDAAIAGLLKRSPAFVHMPTRDAADNSTTPRAND